MGDAKPDIRLDYEAFLSTVEGKEGRYELHDGVAYAMAGGTRDHARIGGNAFLVLSRIARGRGCEAYGTELFVRPPETSRWACSPDAWLRCGPPLPGKSTFATDPMVVVEVLSPSTMQFDRGAKMDLYFAIPSVEHVVLVYQDTSRVEVWSRRQGDVEARNDARWDVVASNSLDGVVRLPALDAEIAMTELYDGVSFA
jgi:Uma2 family endonuclease